MKIAKKETENFGLRFRLKTLRKAKGIKQGELAKMISVSPSMFSKYENGTCSPTIHSLILIAEALETTTDFLLGLSNCNLKNVIMTLNRDNSLSGFIHAVIFKATVDYFPELTHLPEKKVNEKIEKIVNILLNNSNE